MRGFLVTAILVGALAHVCSGEGFNASVAPAAQSYRGGGQAVRPDSGGLIVCEAEEFHVEEEGAEGTPERCWQARDWGENYYAATLANTFLSRKAYLGAPPVCEACTATTTIQVDAPGRYLVLARYEAAYRFETQFTIRIEQGGKTVFERLYGARDNVKIWAFGKKLTTEVAWGWGAVENMVWEGHDAAVELQAGQATIRLIAGRQPAPQAKRNVDLIMLTADEEQVKTRIEKEGYLPLDGMLTQAGDVVARVRNASAVSSVRVTFNPCHQHSPYWVHMRNWKAQTVTAGQGETTDWEDVGGVLDTLNDGQWKIDLAAQTDGRPIDCVVEFGVRTADGSIESIAEFPSKTEKLMLAYDANTRYTRRIRRDDDVLFNLLAVLKAHPVRGTVPTKTPIFAYTFEEKTGDLEYMKALDEFKRMFALKSTTWGKTGRTYIDVRSVPTEKLTDYCRDLGKGANTILAVSLGDEIGLPNPSGSVQEDFRAWLKGKGLSPQEVRPSAKTWQEIDYSPGAKDEPGLYYWSQRYRHHYGIQAIKSRTDILRRHLPNAGIGANFSPHHGGYVHAYLGEVYKWVTCFREEGMTMPWSEDYIWQVPVGTEQMNSINLDLFRAGLRHRPDARIHYYVMPHWPGNTPRMWRRQFYGDLGHGMKIVNLFEFRPVQAAYTENHVSSPEMYLAVRKAFWELGPFEDIVQSGQVRPAQCALWFSDTADIWRDYEGSAAAGKRALYIAIRHNQIPLDFVVEEDALDGTLASYKALYLTDEHVSRAASKAISKWVHDGGVLFTTAGAGSRDERDAPNEILEKLLGVTTSSLDDPEPGRIAYIKQDMPFAEAGTAVWTEATNMALPIVGTRSAIQVADAEVQGSFDNGAPAITRRTVGKGTVWHCAFLPGLSYFKPAIPMRPVDRGSTDDAMAHFMPTAFSEAARLLIATAAAGTEKPVTCSEPLVEAMIVESKAGCLITLANWRPEPIKGLTVTANIRLPGKSVTLASGGKVQARKQDGVTVFTLDLDVADALILR